ncbi:MAG: hypothetical protein PW786_02290 [Arachidicoccus sp.]|nr:hypothetical protein [Arachidicoccus sp.]
MKQHEYSKIKEASKNVDGKGAVNYEVDVRSKAYIFDEGGNFIKTFEDD